MGGEPQMVRQLAERQQDGELQPRQPHDPEDQAPPGPTCADGHPERGAQAELECREDRKRPLRIVDPPMAAVLDEPLPPVHRPVQEVAPEGTRRQRRDDPNTDRPPHPSRGMRAADRSGGQHRQPGHEEARDQHLGEGMDGHGVRGNQRRREREHQEPGHAQEKEDRWCRP